MSLSPQQGPGPCEWNVWRSETYMICSRPNKCLKSDLLVHKTCDLYVLTFVSQ